jgi:hypothetical protein
LGLGLGARSEAIRGLKEEGERIDYLIHCGSSVTVSPGVIMAPALLENLSPLNGDPPSSMSISSSESESVEVCPYEGAWACGASGRMVKVIAPEADN